MGRPLKVIHLLLRFYFAGAEAGVLKLVNGFDRARVQPAVCGGLPPDSIVDLLRADVPIHTVPRRPSGNDPAWVLRLCGLLRRERPDILHTHGWPTLLEGVLAARLARVPLVVHGEHGTIERRPRNLRIQRFLWGRTNGILSVSSTLSATLASVVGVPADRITTIRNGVDTVRFRPSDRLAARAVLGLPRNAFIAGTVGRLHPVKDQRSFLSAIAIAKQSGVPVHALVVGDGGLRQDLETHAVALGIAANVTFLGSRADVETVLASLDAFVLSSESEGLSNVILEAMAAGRAVVATEVGGNHELVVPGQTGLLVPVKDPDALARALMRLAADASLIGRLGIAGRSRAETEFSLDTMVKRYEDFYVKLAARQGVG
jgi:sugar transferase (PEP-CTERM/EpsH1 system associated)